MNSDEIVARLKPYGKVNIHQHDDGTVSANINLFVTGMDATVRSGYQHPTMLSALTELQAKVKATLAGVRGLAQEAASG